MRVERGTDWTERVDQIRQWDWSLEIFPSFEVLSQGFTSFSEV